MTMLMRVLAAVAALVLLGVPAAAQIFTDMRDHPSRRAAERLAAKGIVTRLPDGRLAPDEPLTRLDMAVFLARTIGLPTGGVRVPDFRDVDQIPPGDRPAVAAAVSLGTVSARRVELRKGTVTYTFTVNKVSYAPDETVEMTLTIANEGPGRETVITGLDRGRPRIRLSEGLRAGYEGQLYVETQRPQGPGREAVGRVRVVDVRNDGTLLEVVEPGKVEPRAGLRVFFLPDVWFEYATSQFHDFIVRDVEGNEVARWSLNRPFQAVDRPWPLAAGARYVEMTRWRQLDQNDQPVRPGRYELVAVHTTKDNPTQLVIGFQRGVITAFPDNTFRPRQPVTRAELAAFVVRAMGLAGEAVHKANDPLRIPDAGDVPVEHRGSVVVALERRLVLPAGDGAFRPGRTATRGDAVLAFNALMEALGRYDYTTATLREIRGGPPPIVVVEDANKQIRSHRVAVLSAIYRNDQPVLLLQLRPGDQLKMLKPTDAGEVMYIEATGR
ncbi:MAG: S-layer homology domain-containing protein [Armatimonadota bacterium]|nr:S-layer homology domain-containing protein [Armatimonadota bacterium]MDR7485014.1 S-layer homology domain-containing protein [Armatimonadota bacterium]MDR7533685.1 S-layer homology domain-containing protein [Armatimonadota bacterium]MDR7535528.1 S-layer homology domain-containing protein [Armatimonadota bacterium]